MTDTTCDARQIADAIGAFTRKGPQGARIPLIEVAPFAWDEVNAFAATMPLAIIEAALGEGYSVDEDVAARMTSDSALLVFRHGGAIVCEVVVGPPTFMVGLTGRSHRAGAATLVVATRDPGPYSAVRLAAE